MLGSIWVFVRTCIDHAPPDVGSKFCQVRHTTIPANNDARMLSNTITVMPKPFLQVATDEYCSDANRNDITSIKCAAVLCPKKTHRHIIGVSIPKIFQFHIPFHLIFACQFERDCLEEVFDLT